jgi:hypothetical protein
MQNQYWLDGDDTIIGVGSTWDCFAGENDGHEVVAELVVGRSLWDFISGDPTRMWLSSLLTLARLREETISRPYRCDSPTVKRFMNLEITRDPGGVLKLSHHLVRVEAMHTPCTVSPKSSPGKKMLQRCSVCNRFNASQGWVEAEDLEAPVPWPITVIYAVCGDCMRFMSR